MKWDVLIKAYPSEKDGILKARALNEMISGKIDRIEIPELAGSDILDGIGSGPLARVLVDVWKDVSGSEPSWDAGELLEGYVASGKVNTVPEDEAELASSVLSTLMIEYLKRLRAKNLDILPEYWDSGACPFCSTHPRVAVDSADSRTLHCPLCGHSWSFPRVRCPFCGNTDYNTLGYFEVEGFDGFKVYYCRECTNFYKVVDSRMRQVSDAETEDALSLELDGIAFNEGFIRQD